MGLSGLVSAVPEALPGSLQDQVDHLRAYGYTHVATPSAGRKLEEAYGRILFPVPIYPAQGVQIFAAVDPERAAELLQEREPTDPSGAATWRRYEPRGRP